MDAQETAWPESTDSDPDWLATRTESMLWQSCSDKPHANHISRISRQRRVPAGDDQQMRCLNVLQPLTGMRQFCLCQHVRFRLPWRSPGCGRPLGPAADAEDSSVTVGLLWQLGFRLDLRMLSAGNPVRKVWAIKNQEGGSNMGLDVSMIPYLGSLSDTIPYLRREIGVSQERKSNVCACCFARLPMIA